MAVLIFISIQFTPHSHSSANSRNTRRSKKNSTMCVNKTIIKSLFAVRESKKTDYKREKKEIYEK